MLGDRMADCVDHLERNLDLPFSIDLKRAEFADRAYSSLGRALAFATRLERNCLALAVLVGLRTNPLVSQDENRLSDFCAFMHKRRLGNAEQLPDDVFAVLDEARQARDHITHKAAINIEAQLKTDDGHTRMLDGLSTAVRKMAEADWIVCFATSMYTNKLLPSDWHSDTYAEQVVNWVCDNTSESMLQE